MRVCAFRFILAAVPAAILAGGLAAPAAEQPPSQSQIPDKIAPPLTPQTENNGQEKFKREDGVVRPPSDVDPEMESKPRDGGRTPVIPPPGAPGGNENVHPK